MSKKPSTTKAPTQEEQNAANEAVLRILDARILALERRVAIRSDTGKPGDAICRCGHARAAHTGDNADRQCSGVFMFGRMSDAMGRRQYLRCDCTAFSVLQIVPARAVVKRG